MLHAGPCGYFRLTAVFPVSSWGGVHLTQQNRSSNRQEAVQARQHGRVPLGQQQAVVLELDRSDFKSWL